MVLAVLAVVFSVFTGMAYMMDTIVSWNTPLVSIEILGVALLGGALLGQGVLFLAGADEAPGSHLVRSTVSVIGLVGFVAASIAAFGFAEYVSALLGGSVLIAGVMPYMIAALVLGVVAVICLAVAGFSKSSASLVLVGAAIAIIAQLLVRLAFYACQMSVGL